MTDEEFEKLRRELDIALDAEGTGRLGIEMGFELAGAFLVRNLLEIVRVELLWPIEGRKYRGRYIYPNPSIDGLTYYIGGH